MVGDDLVDKIFYLLYLINMIGMRKKWIYLPVMTLVVGLFFSHARVFAINEFSINTISNQLFSQLNTVSNVQNIISSYCKAVLTTPAFTKDGFVYNAKYSTFVYLLCNNVNKSASLSKFSTDSEMYFTRKTFSELWFEDMIEDTNVCSPMRDECDLATTIPNLFNDIITDYVNMKQANIYGLAWIAESDTDIEDQINYFSTANFGINICEKKDRLYPATCRAMKSYFKNARNLLSDVRILNVPWILTKSNPIMVKNSNQRNPIEIKESPDMENCLIKDEDYNILLCGIAGDTATSFGSFVNLTYNELFYYRLFMPYYFLILQKNPKILNDNIFNKDISVIMKKFSSQYIRSKEALSITFRMMRDTYMAFPFHIGFLMYQEDLDGFGKLFSKIVTPIYTLDGKLRNVQKPQ